MLKSLSHRRKCGKFGPFSPESTHPLEVMPGAVSWAFHNEYNGRAEIVRWMWLTGKKDGLMDELKKSSLLFGSREWHLVQPCDVAASQPRLVSSFTQPCLSCSLGDHYYRSSRYSETGRSSEKGHCDEDYSAFHRAFTIGLGVVKCIIYCPPASISPVSPTPGLARLVAATGEHRPGGTDICCQHHTRSI
jgi:hypothetical protein